MDQTAAASGRRGHAMLLDCRSLHMSYVQVPDDVSIVVMDTGTRRTLATSEFNERRAACQTAVAALRAVASEVRALRDVTPEMLDAVESSLDPVILRRARHVVHENLRPMALSRALAARDFAAAGQLMDASHRSLRDLYEVSGVHLDIICETARAHPACYGARMTGAGFGGCAIALVATDSVETFIAETKPRYEARTYKRSDLFPVTADDGARLEPTRRQ
jgi:galactokinase